jgi:hypothetical protein
MAPPAQPAADAAPDREYAPRFETERALGELAEWLEGPVATAVVAGAPGAGTTFVLRAFERRERGRRHVLFSPFLHIEPEALERWLGGLAFASPPGALDLWLAGTPGAPPLLLVDEAHAATPATLEALARLREARAPELRICIGGCAGPALECAARSVGGADAVVIELPPWSTEDLRGLAEALCAPPAPDLEQEGHGAVDPAALAAAAEGSPGLLREAWSALRDRVPLPTAMAMAAAPAATPAEPVPALAAPPPAETPAPHPSEEAPAPQPAAPEPLRASRAPSAVPQRPPPAQAPPRRARAPWYYAAALGIGFALGFLGGWQGWEGWGDPEVAPGATPEPTALAAVASAPPEPAPLTYHDVQVNARPWAWIKIDGKAVGVTPLVHRDLASGAHEFEATFPDGRQQRRTVTIGPDSRFVSFHE